MEDPFQAVAELTESLMVSVASGPEFVVVALGPRRLDHRAESPLVGIAHPAIPGTASQHNRAVPRGLGDRLRADVVLARLGVGETSPIITELAQHPGTEDRP